MNTFQKVGAFVARIFGAGLAIVGAVGPLYAGLLVLFGQEAPDYTMGHISGSVAWVLLGVVLLVASRPLGVLLGRGLD